MVMRDISKAIKYYKLAAEQDDASSLYNLGCCYLKGVGVKQDYLKAKEYFERSAKQGNSSALSNLGYLYSNGLGVTKDYPRARYYYKLSAEQNDPTAFNNLGDLYLKGDGVEKNYAKAKEYYEIAAKMNYSGGYISLGALYYHGYGVPQNFLEAKKQYELGAKQNDSRCLYKIGKLYAKGYGVQQNYEKAKYYYELSARQNNSFALFHLSEMFSTGEVFDIDLAKSIEYLKKCSQIHYEEISVFMNKSNKSYEMRYNHYCFISSNNLGLIYILNFQDKKTVCEGVEYIKESAFAEYPFAQNNFGILNEYYLNNIGNAKYMYERSSKHHFSLAEFNLGHLYEKDNQIEESMKYYLAASSDEDAPLIFHDHKHKDTRLEISKTFIICFANLKLTKYYFDKGDYEESKKYFIRSLSKLNDPSHAFRMHFNQICDQNQDQMKKCLMHLKSYILSYPKFNLQNQPNLASEMKTQITNIIQYFNQSKTSEDQNVNRNHQERIIQPQPELQLKIETQETCQMTSKETEEEQKLKQNQDKIYEYVKKNIDEMKAFKITNEGELSEQEGIENTIESPEEFFNIVSRSERIRPVFEEELKEIISIMNEIIYTPPYNILFGRLNICRPKEIRPNNQHRFDINSNFYEGFEHDLL